jgi:tungstate transport system substrate-binding protein
MNNLFTRAGASALAVCLLLAGTLRSPAAHGESADRSIVVASTTSTQDSGLFEYLLPLFKERSGITVKVLALGTGQALDVGRRGDADVVFVHAKEEELKFLAQGDSARRYPVMYNDFVLVGPSSDPAHIGNVEGIAKALQAIRDGGNPFISRGDRSGTHIAELKLWQEAGIDIDRQHGDWYRSIGQGMGAALNTASASDAYTLSDRATWIHFKNKGELKILVAGDPHLFNQYGVMLVSPAKHPSVRKDLGQAFIDYLISPAGQQDIAGYRVDGQQLFFPNARDPNA